MTSPAIGHNSSATALSIEVRLFNSMSRFAGPEGIARAMTVSAGTTVGDLVRTLGLPIGEIFLVLRNGRDITPGLYQGGVVNTELAVEDGDTVAFSGPVPYSYGYGAPIV